MLLLAFEMTGIGVYSLSILKNIRIAEKKIKLEVLCKKNFFLENYEESEWRNVAIHFHREKKVNKVSLYVNCRLVDTKVANIHIKHAPKDDLELRLVQREIAGKIFSRYKVIIIIIFIT